MDGRELTSFEQILLGLICRAPASGYDLKRTFAVTPMGVYQPSSGALYPALRRLELRGLVQAEPPSAANGRPARQRRVYQATDAGRAVNMSWLRAPVETAAASRDLGLHLMRFVMMEHLFPREEVLAFLRSLADALAGLCAQLERYMAGTDIADGHPRLALEHGLSVHRASLRWAEDTITTLSAAALDEH